MKYQQSKNNYFNLIQVIYDRKYSNLHLTKVSKIISITFLTSVLLIIVFCIVIISL